MDQDLKIKPSKEKIGLIILSSVTFITLVLGFIFFNTFGPRGVYSKLEQFTIPLNAPSDLNHLAILLKRGGYIRSELGFKIAYLKTTNINSTDLNCDKCFNPGAYRLSKRMSAWKIAKVIKDGPYMKWVVIPEGLRKEQIVELIGDALAWDDQEKRKWVGNFTALKYNEIEGVYFPDSYLIPVDESGLEVANRLRRRFNLALEPYYKEALKQNIKWDTLIKIASIVEREAAGKEDMPLIAGIIWNRLLSEPAMKLEIDATIQYIRDSVIHYGKIPSGIQLSGYVSEGDWWSPIKAEDINIESPYNTYLNHGLPPQAICNPGVEAIAAVLNPTETDCFYYIHSNRIIHCAKSYEEHKENIRKYLR